MNKQAEEESQTTTVEGSDITVVTEETTSYITTESPYETDDTSTPATEDFYTTTETEEMSTMETEELTMETDDVTASTPATEDIQTITTETEYETTHSSTEMTEPFSTTEAADNDVIDETTGVPTPADLPEEDQPVFDPISEDASSDQSNPEDSTAVPTSANLLEADESAPSVTATLEEVPAYPEEGDQKVLMLESGMDLPTTTAEPEDHTQSVTTEETIRMEEGTTSLPDEMLHSQADEDPGVPAEALELESFTIQPLEEEPTTELPGTTELPTTVDDLASREGQAEDDAFMPEFRYDDILINRIRTIVDSLSNPRVISPAGSATDFD